MAVKTPKLPLLAARSAHRVDFLQLHIADAACLEAALQAGVLPTRSRAAAADSDPDAFPLRLRTVGHVCTAVRLAHVEWVSTTKVACQEVCLLLEDGTVSITDVGAAAAAVAVSKHNATARELKLRQLCGPDGQAPGWRGLCVLGAYAATRYLVIADAQALWGVPQSDGGARRRIFTLGGGQPTRETFTALTSLRSGTTGTTKDVSVHLVVAATDRRLCILDTAPATAGDGGGGANALASLVLTWVHNLGHSDPPRLLTCGFGAPWVTGTAGVTTLPPEQAPTDRSWVITAVTCHRAAARAVQCVFARPMEAAALQQKDTHGWASKLRECVLGARAVGVLSWLPSPIALHTQRHHVAGPFAPPPSVPVGSDTASDKLADVAATMAVSDPHCCGFFAVPPLGNNAAGVVLACDRKGTLYATPVMHTRRGDGDVQPTGAGLAVMPLEAAAAKPSKRTKGCALPVHSALLAGGAVVDPVPGVPHVTAADCIAAVTQSPWPLTRLEVAFEAARRATARACASRVDPGVAAEDASHWVPHLRDSALVVAALPTGGGVHRTKLAQTPAAAARAALDQVLGPTGDGTLTAGGPAAPLLTSSTSPGTAIVMAPPAARALDVAEAALRGDARIARAAHGSTLCPASLNPPHAAAPGPGVAVVPLAGPHAAAVVACAAACAGWLNGDCSTSAGAHDSAYYVHPRGNDLPAVLARALVPMPAWADAAAMAELERRMNPGAASAPPLTLRPPPAVRSQAMAPPPPRLPASQGFTHHGDGAGPSRPSSQQSQGGSQGFARPAKRRREGF